MSVTARCLADLQAASQARAIDGSHDGLWGLFDLLQHVLAFLRECRDLLDVAAALDHAVAETWLIDCGKQFGMCWILQVPLWFRDPSYSISAPAMKHPGLEEMRTAL